jgi:hypothetical protein
MHVDPVCMLATAILVPACFFSPSFLQQRDSRMPAYIRARSLAVTMTERATAALLSDDVAAYSLAK